MGYLDQGETPPHTHTRSHAGSLIQDFSRVMCVPTAPSVADSDSAQNVVFDPLSFRPLVIESCCTREAWRAWAALWSCAESCRGGEGQEPEGPGTPATGHGGPFLCVGPLHMGASPYCLLCCWFFPSSRAGLK